jgi:hypothetical protein
MHLAVSIKRNDMESMGRSGGGVTGALNIRRLCDEIRSQTQLGQIPRDHISMNLFARLRSDRSVLRCSSSYSSLIKRGVAATAIAANPTCTNFSSPFCETGKCCVCCTYEKCAGCDFHRMAAENLCVQKTPAESTDAWNDRMRQLAARPDKYIVDYDHLIRGFSHASVSSSRHGAATLTLAECSAPVEYNAAEVSVAIASTLQRKSPVPARLVFVGDFTTERSGVDDAAAFRYSAAVYLSSPMFAVSSTDAERYREYCSSAPSINKRCEFLRLLLRGRCADAGGSGDASTIPQSGSGAFVIFNDDDLLPADSYNCPLVVVLYTLSIGGGLFRAATCSCNEANLQLMERIVTVATTSANVQGMHNTRAQTID